MNFDITQWNLIGLLSLGDIKIEKAGDLYRASLLDALDGTELVIEIETNLQITITNLYTSAVKHYRDLFPSIFPNQ